MTKLKLILSLITLASAGAQGQSAGVLKLFPKTPKVFVTDSAGILTPEAIAVMNLTAQTTQASVKGDIAYVTIPTIGDYQPYEVAGAIGRTWKVGGTGPYGSETRNLGVVFLIVPRTASHGGTCFIAPGMGAEGFITDAKAGEICRGLVPALKRGNYSAAMIAGGEELQQLMLDHVKPVVRPTTTPSKIPNGFIIVVIAIGLGLIGLVIYRITRKKPEPVRPDLNDLFDDDIRIGRNYIGASPYISPGSYTSPSSSSSSSSSDDDDSSSSSSSGSSDFGSDFGNSSSGSSDSFGGGGGFDGGGGGSSF